MIMIGRGAFLGILPRSRAITSSFQVLFNDVNARRESSRAQVFAKVYFQDEKAATYCAMLLFGNAIISARLQQKAINVKPIFFDQGICSGSYGHRE